mmetsp:Transcript_42086/g.117179  ORF Transcript_42086/g.117179 Transcript_42086/m.117179 type:complete len:317 (+) Transcript_42086:938-1888(+)
MRRRRRARNARGHGAISQRASEAQERCAHEASERAAALAAPLRVAAGLRGRSSFGAAGVGRAAGARDDASSAGHGTAGLLPAGENCQHGKRPQGLCLRPAFRAGGRRFLRVLPFCLVWNSHCGTPRECGGGPADDCHAPRLPAAGPAVLPQEDTVGPRPRVRRGQLQRGRQEPARVPAAVVANGRCGAARAQRGVPELQPLRRPGLAGPPAEGGEQAASRGWFPVPDADFRAGCPAAVGFFASKRRPLLLRRWRGVYSLFRRQRRRQAPGPRNLQGDGVPVLRPLHGHHDEVGAARLQALAQVHAWASGRLRNGAP